MGKTIFITGGSGYIGRTLIALALSQGYTVTALSRSPSSDTLLTSLGAAPIRGDLTTLSILTSSAAASDIVISIADALASDHSLPQTERFRINDAANNALAAGLTGTGKPLITTGGSLHAAALPDHSLTDETSPGWPEGHWAAFDLGGVQRRWLDMGVRVCQVRLAPYVYGRGGSGVGLFMKMWAQAGQGMVIDGGAMWTTTVHVDDAVRLYLLVAEKGRAGESCKCACVCVGIKANIGVRQCNG
jgi:nucleoside-diphosphate-sugar epimerase